MLSICSEWANNNCDRRECPNGFEYSGIKFTDKVFDCLEDAEQFLRSTDGYYPTAVKYKSYKNLKSSKKMLDLERRINEMQKKYEGLKDGAHYEGVKQATIKCKHCGSSLSTKYCGSNRGLLGIGDRKGFKNECPVCSSDLRPQSVIDRQNGYLHKKTILQAEYITAEVENRKKYAKNAETYWAVFCEVHC